MSFGHCDLWLYCLVMHLQAIDLDPTDATLLSNRSLCWIRLDQAEHALDDAKACRALRPDWPKACYREGAALRLLQACFHVPFWPLTFETTIVIFVVWCYLSCSYYCRDLMKQPTRFMRECSLTLKIRSL